MEKNGIELLLKAEDEAAAIVQKARESESRSPSHTLGCFRLHTQMDLFLTFILSCQCMCLIVLFRWSSHLLPALLPPLSLPFSSSSTERVQRLRQAQEEAEKTIRELKAAHKAQFDREIAAKDEGDQGFFADLKSRQSAEQAGIEKGFDKNKEQVINFLLKEVTTVSLEVSEALRQSLLTKAEQGTQ